MLNKKNLYKFTLGCVYSINASGTEQQIEHSNGKNPIGYLQAWLTMQTWGYDETIPGCGLSPALLDCESDVVTTWPCFLHFFQYCHNITEHSTRSWILTYVKE